MKTPTIILLTLLFFLVGCSDLKQEIWIHEDGSATLQAELKMSKDPLVAPDGVNLFTRNIDQSDPNLLSFEAHDDEDDTYLYYSAAATVADFAAFAADKAFGFTKFSHEQYAAGTLVLTQHYESINQDGSFFVPQQMLAIYEDVLADSTATLILHAPSIFYAEGLAIEEDDDGAVVRLELPMLDAMSGMGVESFVVEYALEPAPAKAPPVIDTNANKDTESAVGSGTAGAATVRAAPTRTPTTTTAPAITPTPATEIVTVAGTTPEELTALDSDGDWLTDEEERNLGTNPHLIDSDGDTLSDFEEQWIFRTDPLRVDSDTDDDSFADRVEQDLFATDPAKAETDTDGDLVPDQTEERLGSDPGQIDSDGDLLSDLLELYLLKTDPNEADADEDEDGFPDALEEWVPAYLAETSCAIDVTFQVDNLVVDDPEEADTTSITGGDEALMFYVMSISQDGGYYGLTEENQSGDPRYQGQGWEWQGEGFTNSQFTNFKTIGPLQAPCGYFVVYGAQMIEDDSPFGGYTDMGKFIDGYQLLHQRVPLGWAQSESGVHHFQGVAPDGSYDYAIQYTFTAAIKTAGAPTPIVEKVTEQQAALTVDRSRLAISEETARRLPDTYLSANERLTFRYLADDWTIVEPAGGRIPISYTVLPDGASIPNETETASAVYIYDPVYIIETVARENYDDLTVADIFAAYINKTGVAGTALHPSEPTEIQLGGKSALLWQPATENAHTWLAFRALDRSVNIVQFAMSPDEFAADQLRWLSVAESLDYQAPSRRLDEIEKSLRQFIAGTAIGDYETVQGTICQRNRQTTDMVTGLVGALFDVDVEGLTGAFLSFSSGWTELDTSGLFFETIENSGNVATVMISGVVTLNGENGRETVAFRRFNMTGRNLYRLEQDANEWLVCD